MATLVQENGATGTTGSATVTMGANMTSGNMLVVCGEINDDATGPTISATGVTFTKQNYFVGDVSHDNIILWTGVIAGGAGTVITITAHLNLGSYAFIAAEFSGVQQVVDGTPPTPTNVSSATPSVTSNTPAVSGDLAVAFCGHTDATAPTATPGSWTALTRRAATNSIEGAYFTLPDANAVTPQWTFAVSKFALLDVVLIKAPAASVVPPHPTIVDCAVTRAATY